MLTADLKNSVRMAHPVEWKQLIAKLPHEELEAIKQEQRNKEIRQGNH